MLSVVLQIHRNILSSQCYIRYEDDSNSVNTIQVECASSELELLLLMNDEIVKKIRIVTPDDFFIPSSLSSDSELSSSTIVSQLKLTPIGQYVVECGFRLQISGADKVHTSEHKLKVDVKEFFKERFKDGTYWNTCCASCGADLPLKPVFIKSVQEYSESELSEGWFCHGNGPEPAFQPSSQILYLDDTSCYLNTKPNISAIVPDKNDSANHTDCQTDVRSSNYLNVSDSDQSTMDNASRSSSGVSKTLNQGFNSCDFPLARHESDCQDDVQINECLNISNSDSSNIYIANKSDCCDTKNIIEGLNFCNLSIAHSQQRNINSSCSKKDDSVVKSSIHQTFNDCKYSTVDKNEYLNDCKIVHSAVECQSCGDTLTTEKSSNPFTRFYLDKLMFKNSSVNGDHIEYAHKITLLSFWSLVSKSQTSLLPSKLFFQSKVLCLLLWIPSVPVAQFLLRDSLEGAPTEVHLKTNTVYKVLYFAGSAQSESVRSWSRDFGVDFYRVSDSMVKTLVRILEDSSKCLPETDGDFSCGFLIPPLT